MPTERAVACNTGRTLVAPQTRLSVTAEMCRGCPAYCAMFARLCNLTREAMARAGARRRFSRLKPVADAVRSEMVRQEFVRLCVLLAEANADGHVNEEKMNELMAIGAFEVCVVGL